MRRLVATMVCDLRLQLRNGFYWAVAFLVVAFAVVRSQLPAFDWGPLLPPLVLGNLVVATFMFIAGLLLLERDEGTLAALAMTPLSRREYLASKVATLTALSLLENVAIALIACGTGFRLAPLAAGIVTAAALYCLAGFLAVAPYDSINEFLFPSMLWVLAFSLPILHYAGLVTSPLVYLHPFQAPLVLLGGAIGPLTAWEWIYGVGYSALWIALLLEWSRRTLERRIVAAAAG